MPYKLLTCFFVLVFANVLPIYAQEPSYIHYTIDEGLPSNEVYDVMEDSLGYTWFATDHGISRFDGYTFRNYSVGDGLVHNTVFGFYEDHTGRMWMRTFNSSLCYIENGIIYPYKHNAALQAFLGPNFIQQFAFDNAGNLWFMSVKTQLGFLRQDAMTGKVERVRLPQGYNGFIRELDSGEIIGGVDKDNGYKASLQPDNTVAYVDHTWLFRFTKQNNSFDRGLVRCQRRGKNAYLITHDAQLLLIDDGRISCRAEFNEVINDCYVEPDGTCWVCRSGFYRIDPAAPAASQGIFLSKSGTNMLRDRVGNYWFSSHNDGVFLARNMAVSVLRPFGKIKAGELRDLDLYNDRLIALDHSGDVFCFNHTATGIDTSASEQWPQRFPDANLVYCMPEKNRVIFRTQLMDVSGSHLSPGSVKENPYPIAGATRGYAQTGDSILLATNTSWQILRPDGEVLYNSMYHDFRAFCTSIAYHAGRIWIGTTDGLFIFSEGKTVPYEPGNPLFRQRVTDIKFGKHGELFVSTRGGGVIIIDGDRQYNLREKDGLSSDQCENLCVEDSVLWVCSNTGLNRVAMQRNKNGWTFGIERITTQHGLPSNMVNDAVRVGNLLFLATGKGLCWFDVRGFRLNTLPPPVYIRSFLTNNRETDPSQRTLAWNDNNISIGFIALLFRSPGEVHYRYRLEGYEPHWNYTDERMARYFNLPPGEYTFLVSAMNENGVWNQQPAVVRFYIPTHFTETGWFRFGVILLIAGAAAGIVFYYVKQQRDRARTTLALSLAEQKALRAQMKPHFIFNSLNSIQHFILEHDEESAHLYLSRFSSLMRKILDNTRQNTISLTREIDTLRLYLDLEKLRFGQNFYYAIEVAPDIMTDVTEMPAMLIQPYAENAIWHGLLLCKDRLPRLTIRFSQEGDVLKCEVEDNGIGRKKAQEQQTGRKHESTGMKNIEERIVLLNRMTRSSITVEVTDLYDASGAAAGTRITLRIPSLYRKTE